jgi:fluoroacetyl-CoA thioesterase
LVFLGLLGLIMPIMPGWVFLIPGLVILSDHFPSVRRLVEWAKRKAQLDRLRDHMRGRKQAMAEIPIGTIHEEGFLVTSEVAVDFLGVEDARVLATPRLIGGLERTCRNAVLPFLEPGNDTVGTHVNVYHLSATPIGMRVSFRAEVVSVEERRVNFKVEAFDEAGKIAEGTHQRAVVNVERFAGRVRKKREEHAPG